MRPAPAIGAMDKLFIPSKTRSAASPCDGSFQAALGNASDQLNQPCQSDPDLARERRHADFVVRDAEQFIHACRQFANRAAFGHEFTRFGNGRLRRRAPLKQS